MAWTAITAAATDADSPLDQALLDLIRTNDADHEVRIAALEGSGASAAFTHFFDTEQLMGTAAVTPASHLVEVETNGGATFTVDATDHVLVTSALAATEKARAKLHHLMRPTWLPKVTILWKITGAHTDLAGFFIGAIENMAFATAAPDHGVFVEIETASTDTFRFVTRNGGTPTSGTSTFVITEDTWTEIEIEWTTATNIVCRVNGSDQETFTGAHNIPDAADDLYLIAGIQEAGGVSGEQLHLDRLRSANASVIDQS